MSEREILEKIMAICEKHDLSVSIQKNCIWICKTAFNFRFEMNYTKYDSGEPFETICQEFLSDFELALAEEQERFR